MATKKKQGRASGDDPVDSPSNAGESPHAEEIRSVALHRAADKAGADFRLKMQPGAWNIVGIIAWGETNADLVEAELEQATLEVEARYPPAPVLPASEP